MTTTWSNGSEQFPPFDPPPEQSQKKSAILLQFSVGKGGE